MERSERLLNPQTTNAELERIYKDAELVDRDTFAEQRSNVLLVAGDHYVRRHQRFNNQVRLSREINQEQKLRLTNNHIERIHNAHCTNISGSSPQVIPKPKHESEMQDRKAAEIDHAVWRDAVERYNVPEKIEDWCDSFGGMGEVATKIFFDPDIGELKGFEQKLDEDDNPMFDEFNEPVADKSLPVMRGGFVFEDVFGFNLLRAPEAKSMDASPYLIIRKMVDRELLMKQFPRKKKLIQESRDETFLVFDESKKSFRRSENEVFVMEFLYRPSKIYPNGKFFLKTKEGILEQGDLPGGIFPLVFQTYKKTATSPRGISYIRTARPFQAEINRTVSKIAEHQTAIGDDKVLIQNGTKVSSGKSLPGVKTINYTGAEPKILAGRDGSQYLQHMLTQIDQMYKALDLELQYTESKGTEQPFVVLFKAASQKRRFSRPIKRYENFLKNVCTTYLKLAKHHFSDDEFILSVGRNEAVNIKEFKNGNSLGVEIVVEPQSEDLETSMGKTIALQYALQFGGDKLTREDLGTLLAEMPFANLKHKLGSITLNVESANNYMLALERGESPEPSQFDDSPDLVQRLDARMRQADFKVLSPEIQNLYLQHKAIHIQLHSENLRKQQALNADFIPTDGPLVVVDFYVRDPKDPLKTRRAKLPHNAVQWLINRLSDQGASLEQLEGMNQGSISQLSDLMNQRAGAGGQNGQVASAIPQGAGNEQSNPFGPIPGGLPI